jgi:hypothetical protein
MAARSGLDGIILCFTNYKYKKEKDACPQHGEAGDLLAFKCDVFY